GGAFLSQWADAESIHRDRISEAQDRLDEVTTPDSVLETIAELCIALGADGLRGELTLMRTARALAAFTGESAVTTAHIRAVAPSALRHRLRRDPLDEAGSTSRVNRAVDDVLG
ncbi:MAG: magnesium chelatase ATPase subunit I, partial [Pseudomonadota bacterium]